MKIILLALTVFSAGALLHADEIIITASRHESLQFDAPYNTVTITSEDIQGRLFAGSLPEVFKEEPAIAVQKTAAGMGSPYIRGFTGFRNLFMIDGIRLNNSVFREGPNQYWNTVDPFSVRQLEIIKGPASVLYGTDAVGGAVNAVSGSYVSGIKYGMFSPRILELYSAVDGTSITRMEAESVLGEGGSTTKYLSLGGTFKDFQDIKSGGNTGVQEKTGYADFAQDLKFELITRNKSRFALLFQNVRQDDIWRTHRTIYAIPFHGTVAGTDKKHVFDQQRQLAYCQYTTPVDSNIVSRFKASLSYHAQEEDQFVVKKDGKSEKSGIDVKTLGFWMQAETPALKIGTLVFGAEYYHDNVGSFTKKYKASGALDKAEIQGPVADDADYGLFGVFVQDEYGISANFLLTAGLRYTKAEADADKVKDPVSSGQIALSDSWNNLSGNVRLSYHMNENAVIYGGISQGFRAPNLSDLTRYDIAQSGQKEIPNTSLSPEKFISYEAGVKTRGPRLDTEISFYYTDITDMIMRYPTGNTIDGNYEVQKANIGNGSIYGWELKTHYRFDGSWELFGGIAFARGEVATYAASVQEISDQPMNKVQPVQGVLGLRWNQREGGYWAELVARGADKQDRLSPEDKLDTQRIPPGGTPGWIVLTLKAGMHVTDYFSITAAIENISDKEYRIHGSGSNESGTNVILGLEFKF